MPIYLDNAATSFPKPEAVYRAMDDTMRRAGGNPGRGSHQLALAANRIVLAARETIAEFFGIEDSSRVVFTGNATEALNLALFGMLRPGNRVVTTNMEHNAVARPLRLLQERGVEVVRVAADRTGFVDPRDFQAACSVAPTTLAVLGHVSNVTGTIQALDEIGPWCRTRAIPLLVDAAQSAGLLPIDVAAMGIAFLAAPGHKGLLGPVGTGFLYVQEGLKLEPVILGGTGANSHSDLMPEEMPERLESGTPNTPGLAGLTAGVEYLRRLGNDAVQKQKFHCMERLVCGLGAIGGICMYGPVDPQRLGGVLSFNVIGVDPAEVGFRLDRDHDICVRVGLHCAPDAHRAIGTYPHGTVRVSPGHFTTDAELDRFLAAMRTLITK